MTVIAGREQVDPEFFPTFPIGTVVCKIGATNSGVVVRPYLSNPRLCLVKFLRNDEVVAVRASELRRGKKR